MLLKDKPATKQMLLWPVPIKELLWPPFAFPPPPWKLQACCRTGYNLISDGSCLCCCKCTLSFRLKEACREGREREG